MITRMAHRVGDVSIVMAICRTLPSSAPQHCATHAQPGARVNEVKKPQNTAQRTMFKDMLRTIARVPRGKVCTYGDIAFAAGYPGAARQVAWALHGFGATVPWQRIVGAGGNILLAGEHGFEQRLRLQSEGVAFLGMRVNMAAHRHSFFPEKSTRPAKKAAKSAKGKRAAIAKNKIPAKKSAKVAAKTSTAKNKGRTRRP